MLLAKSEIINLLNREEDPLVVSGLNFENVKGCNIDLALGSGFKKLTGQNIINPLFSSTIEGTYTTIDKDMVLINPGELVLGITEESVTIPKTHVGFLDGRSTLARLGLCVHITAGRIDPGWAGNIVLEILNPTNNTFVLTAGMQIAALTLQPLLGDVGTGYSERTDAKYKDQNSIILPKT